MPRFDFQSPGSAASDNIEKFLLERRAEQRQALLDQLNSEQVRHGMKTADANLDINRGNLGINQSAEQRAKERDLEDTLQKRLALASDKADPSSFTPELYSFAKGIGRIQPTAAATPSITTSTMIAPPEGASPEALEEYAKNLESQPVQQETSSGPQIPAGERFVGSQDYEKEQRVRGYLDKLIADNPEIAQNKELMQSLMIQQAGGDVDTKLLGSRKAFIYDHTGKLKNTQELGLNDEIKTLPQPYMMPAWGAPKAYQEMDIRTGRVIRSHSLNQDQYAVLAEQLAPQGHILVATTAPFGAGQGADHRPQGRRPAVEPGLRLSVRQGVVP